MFEPMSPELWLWLTTHGVRILILLIVAALAYRFLQAGMTRFDRALTARSGSIAQEQQLRALTLANIFRSVGIVVIITIATFMLLAETGIDIAPLIAGASVVGLAIGLGAQTLVKDVIGGLFVLLEDQFHVGDVVRVGPVSGAVERITLRATYLRDGDGTLHLVPNGELRIVSNTTSGWSRAVVDVPLANDQPLAKVLAALEAVAREASADETLKPLLLEPLTVTGLEALDMNQMRLRVIGKTKAGKQVSVALALRRRIKDKLDAEGIALSAPQAIVLQDARE